MTEQQQYPTPKQVAEAIYGSPWTEVRDPSTRAYYLDVADTVLALFPQPTPSAEPKRMLLTHPHDGHGPGDTCRNCTVAPPSIADMAPGTTNNTKENTVTSTATTTVEFERGVREGAHNALSYFRDENGFSTVDEESGDSLDRIEAKAIEETLADEAQRAAVDRSLVTASDIDALRAHGRAFNGTSNADIYWRSLMERVADALATQR